MFKTFFKTDKQKKHIVITKVDDVTLNGLLEAMFRKKTLLYCQAHLKELIYFCLKKDIVLVSLRRSRWVKTLQLEPTGVSRQRKVNRSQLGLVDIDTYTYWHT